MEGKRFEEAERIIGWREMQPNYWYYIDMETRGTKKWNKPITVISVKSELSGPKIQIYAPPSLHYGLKAKPNTTIILYEGLSVGASGISYPKYRYAA